MRKYINSKSVMAVIFLFILSFFFIMNLNSVYPLVKNEVKAIIFSEYRDALLSPQNIENVYNENFYGKLDFVDINGVVHKAMGQKLVNGAIKAENGKLFLDDDKNFVFDRKKEAVNVENAKEILEAADDIGATTLYVQRPHKFIDAKDKLPYGMNIEFNKQYDFWCENIKDSGENIIDLRKAIYSDLDFYVTDHHWTVESSFYAAKSIIEKLNLIDPTLHLDESLYDEGNYSIVKYKDSFLGSEGVKTGKYYVGKDDFNILIPRFSTNLEYKHYINNEITLSKNGVFTNTFIYNSILENDDYYNKYNACLYGGYVENIVKNLNCKNGKKVLLISDSFARPMTMYLSMAFEEIHYLDPQEGRYNDSYIKYIEEYRPDIVIMMYTGEFQQI